MGLLDQLRQSYQAGLAEVNANRDAQVNIPPDAEPLNRLPDRTETDANGHIAPVAPPPVPLHVRSGLGLLARILDVLERQFLATPDDPYILDLSANLATDVPGPAIAQSARLRALTLTVLGTTGAMGLTTVSLFYPGAPQAAPGAIGGRVIYSFGMTSNQSHASPDGLNIRIPAGAQLSVKTTAATPTRLVLVALITREPETGARWFTGGQR